MPKEDDEQEKWRLLRYFLGDALLGDVQRGPEDEDELGARLQADPSWQLLPEGEGVADEAHIDWDTPGELRKLRDRLDLSSEDGPSEEEASRPARADRPAHTRRSTHTPAHRSAGRRRQATPLLRTAGVMALVICVALLVEVLWAPFGGGGGRDVQTAASMRVVATEEGQRATIRLSGGTRVMLNVDSKLRIPAPLGEGAGARNVYLEGAAYFDVAPDAARPFRVHLGGAVVRVLGTAFGARAYPEDEGRHVVVAEGRVTIRPAGEEARAREESAREEATRKEGAGGNVHLTRGQMGRWRQGRAGAVQVTQDADVEEQLAWRSGRLVFERTPLGEVARRLERWYALDVTLGDAVPAGRSFTGSFASSTPAGEVLATIAFAFGLHYRKQGPVVIFRSRSP